MHLEQWLQAKDKADMTLGNLAYNAWRGSLDDETMPAWEDIRPQEKIAWEYAAATIRDWVAPKENTAPRRAFPVAGVR